MGRGVRVAIVGAGMGGIAAAIEVRRRGVEDVVLFERGDRVGGTWRANVYPGLACDVPSHYYSLSYAPNPDWSRRFSPGSEIREYVEQVAREHGVLERVRFNTEVHRAAWDDADGRWRLTVGDGETVHADAVITACGQLSRPSVPDVAGLGRFAGPMFHSAHWDHQVDLTGRRVCVLGTGASAIQFVPEVAERAHRVTVFQRSAPWVFPKPDREYPERVKRLHRRRPLLPRLWRWGWAAWMESTVPLFTGTPPAYARVARAYYAALATAVRVVQLRFDRRLLAATRPTEPIGCKRILITSDWYPTLRRPDVDLVTEPVREVVADGVLTADGRHHRADVLVLGTGFRSTEFLAPMEVEGRDGTRLADAWAHGAEAYLGIAVPRFPNLFLLYGPNTNHGTGSIVEMLEMQARYAADGVRMLADGAAERLEVRQEAHDAFQAELRERLSGTVWADCQSWYVTAQGRITNNWPGSWREYRRRTRRLDPADYRTAAPRPSPAHA